MKIYYYLSLFPTEAIVASHLEPNHFGAYMATGNRRGSAERMVFIEIEPGFEGIDWDYAEAHCVLHDDGRVKNSVYLSIYRSLETVPLDACKSMYLTTRDGSTLRLEKGEYIPENLKPSYYVYQELCPVNPLVVSNLTPVEFSEHITSETESKKIYIPKLAFADLKVINFDDLSDTGNIGSLYDHNLRHLKYCVESLRNSVKSTKTLNRCHVESFSFNVIRSGVYLTDGKDVFQYRMPDVQELNEKHYNWARSAQII